MNLKKGLDIYLTPEDYIEEFRREVMEDKGAWGITKIDHDIAVFLKRLVKGSKNLRRVRRRVIGLLIVGVLHELSHDACRESAAVEHEKIDSEEAFTILVGMARNE